MALLSSIRNFVTGKKAAPTKAPLFKTLTSPNQSVYNKTGTTFSGSAKPSPLSNYSTALAPTQNRGSSPSTNIDGAYKNPMSSLVQNYQNQKAKTGAMESKMGVKIDPTGAVGGLRNVGTKGLSLAQRLAGKGSTSKGSGFSSGGASFAERFANLSDGPMSTYKPPKVSNLERRTTQNRPNIDTTSKPGKVSTTKAKPPQVVDDVVENVPKKKFPVVKTALGLGATGLAVSPFFGNDDDTNQSVPDVLPEQTASAATDSPFAASTVFGSGYEGGAFEAPGAATQDGTNQGGSLVGSLASGLASANAGGGLSGIGGSGGKQNKLNDRKWIDSDETVYEDEEGRRYRYDDKRKKLKDQRDREAQDKEDEYYGGAANRKLAERLAKQESKLQRKIDALLNKQATQVIDIEGSSDSASQRVAGAGVLDREMRKQLVPLQAALAGVQNQLGGLRDRYNTGYAAAQKTPEQSGFTLGEGQIRYQLNPETGEYEQVGEGMMESETEDLPSKVQEYEYAKQQGYQGTYTDFLNVTDAQGGNGDKILTPTEAAALGVPYGTTQAQAYGQTPSKLSGDAAKVQAIAQTMVPEINTLKQRFGFNPQTGQVDQGAYKRALTGYLTGTDRELVKLVDQIADKVGRLRSGGAVNADEEERFKRQIASFLDLPFGSASQAITALDGLSNEATQVSQSVNPYQQNTQTGGGTWDWPE